MPEDRTDMQPRRCEWPADCPCTVPVVGVLMMEIGDGFEACGFNQGNMDGNSDICQLRYLVVRPSQNIEL